MARHPFAYHINRGRGRGLLPPLTPLPPLPLPRPFRVRASSGRLHWQ